MTNIKYFIATKETVSRLIAFLTRNNALGAYLHNTKRRQEWHTVEMLELQKLATNNHTFTLSKPTQYVYTDLINQSFHWSLTPQGHDAWEALDRSFNLKAFTQLKEKYTDFQFFII